MSDLWHFWNLSRPINVLITLLAFALSCYIATARHFYFVEDPQFWIAALCMAGITATGYWVNDVYDFKIDRINKPRKTIVNAHLSTKKVLTAYFVINIGLMVFSFFTQRLLLVGINTLAAGTLFLYAAWLKRSTVVGNLLIASLTALVVYYAALIYLVRAPILWTCMFAFEVTFIRELVKDVEDFRGDFRFNLRTLPIRIGIKGSKRVIIASLILFIGSTGVPFMWEIAYLQVYNWAYLVVSICLVQLPAMYLIYMVQKAAHPRDFGKVSTYLKLLTLSGMLTVLLLN